MELNIDLFEQKRSSKRSDTCPRLPASERFDLTYESGATASAIIRAQKETDIIKKQRLKTMKQTKSQEKMEEMVETAKKSLKRVFSLDGSRDELSEANFYHGTKRRREGSFTNLFS